MLGRRAPGAARSASSRPCPTSPVGDRVAAFRRLDDVVHPAVVLEFPGVFPPKQGLDLLCGEREQDQSALDGPADEVPGDLPFDGQLPAVEHKKVAGQGIDQEREHERRGCDALEGPQTGRPSVSPRKPAGKGRAVNCRIFHIMKILPAAAGRQGAGERSADAMRDP